MKPRKPTHRYIEGEEVERYLEGGVERRIRVFQRLCPDPLNPGTIEVITAKYNEDQEAFRTTGRIPIPTSYGLQCKAIQLLCQVDQLQAERRDRGFYREF